MLITNSKNPKTLPLCFFNYFPPDFFIKIQVPPILHLSLQKMITFKLNR